MTQKRATDDLLSELHGMFARELKGRLQNGEATASDLNVIRQFLKDNGIDSVGALNQDVASLAEHFEFPVSEDDDGNVIRL